MSSRGQGLRDGRSSIVFKGHRGDRGQVANCNKTFNSLITSEPDVAGKI